MRLSARIEDNRVHALAMGMKKIDQFALMIGLMDLESAAGFARECFKPGIELNKRHRTVDFGFALAQEIEIGSVQNKEFHDLPPLGSNRR